MDWMLVLKVVAVVVFLAVTVGTILVTQNSINSYEKDPGGY